MGGADDGGGRDHLAVGRVRVVVVRVQGQPRRAEKRQQRRFEMLLTKVVGPLQLFGKLHFAHYFMK